MRAAPWALVLLFVADVAEAKKPKKSAEEPPKVEEPAAAAAPQGVQTSCDFEPGEVIRYRVDHTEQKTQADAPARLSSSRYDMSFTVISHEGPRSVIDLTYTSYVLVSAPDPVTAELMPRLYDIIGDQTYRLAADHEARTYLVTNPEALTRVGEVIATEMAASLKEKLAAAPPEVLAQALAFTDAMVRNPALLEKGVYEDVMPTLAFSCAMFPAGSTDYAAQLPNPLGGAPFGATGTLVVAETKGGGLRFDDVTRVDPVAALELVRPLFEQAGIVIPEGAPDALLTVRTETALDLDGASPWPSTWSSYRVTSMIGRSDEATVKATRLP